VWLAIMMSIVGGQSSAADVRARIDRSPPDVASFIERRIGCNHWEGEVFPNGFPPRQRKVQHVLRTNHCGRVANDARRLEAKYRSNAVVLTLLKDTEYLLPNELER
jgi:hypothetical protein